VNKHAHVLQRKASKTVFTRFTDGEISYLCGWETAFALNDISGLRRPKNVIFGTKVASSTKMMHTLRFSEKKFF